MITYITIMGPTAVGKTELAIKLAKEFNGEIISVDSRQVYRYLDIGTAKPDSWQLAEVPHHLISIILPTETYTVGKFQEDACRLLHEIKSRGKIPFLVGGTGLYFRAILEGYDFPEQKDFSVREHLKEIAQKHGMAILYQKLLAIDPVAAGRIHPNDMIRIIRALEIYESTGKPISQQQNKQNFSDYKAINIGLVREREDLYNRINLRTEEMFAQGLPEEVLRLNQENYQDSIGFQKTIGYPETQNYLAGLCTLKETKAVIAQKTRNYAKRQITWFKKEKGVNWINLTNLAPEKNFTEIFVFIAGELEKT